jgi:pyruvate/2-oxoglutarate/acetoin dehydrogenase E1 component
MLLYECLAVAERKLVRFIPKTNEAWFTKTPGLKVVYPAFL